MQQKRRRHSIDAQIRNIDLTKAGTSLYLDVFLAGEKVGSLEIGRGSITWWKKNKRVAKRLSWPQFTVQMDK